MFRLLKKDYGKKNRKISHKSVKKKTEEFLDDPDDFDDSDTEYVKEGKTTSMLQTKSAPLRHDKADGQRGDFLLRIARHKLGILFRFVLIIVLLGSLAFIVYLQYIEKEYTAYEVINTVDYPSVSGSTKLRLGNHILIYSNDGASCMNSEGTVLWNRTFEMQDPIVDICGQTVAFADYNGRKIYVMNAETILGEIDTGLPIRSINVSGQGIVAAALEDSGITPIYLYDKEGTEKAYFRTSMDKSGYPLAVDISSSGKLVGISYLFLNAGEVKSNVAFYNFGEVGKNQSDNLVSGYSYSGQVTPVIHFMNDSSAFALSGSRLMLYSGNEKPTNVADVLLKEEVHAVYYGDNYVGLVYNSNDSAYRYRLDVYDKDGTLVDAVQIASEYRDIFFYDQRIVIYDETSCRIRDIGKRDKFNGSFHKAISLVIPSTERNHFMLVSADSVEIIRLQ